MPNYTYKCNSCEGEMQIVKSILEPEPTQCILCNKEDISRIWKPARISTNTAMDKIREKRPESIQAVRNAVNQMKAKQNKV